MKCGESGCENEANGMYSLCLQHANVLLAPDVVIVDVLPSAADPTAQKPKLTMTKEEWDSLSRGLNTIKAVEFSIIFFDILWHVLAPHAIVVAHVVTNNSGGNKVRRDIKAALRENAASKTTGLDPLPLSLADLNQVTPEDATMKLMKWHRENRHRIAAAFHERTKVASK